MNLSQLRWIGAVGGLMVVIALIGIIWSSWPSSPPPPETEERAVTVPTQRQSLTITARQGEWSVVEIPLLHDFEVFYRGTTRVCVNRDARGCHREFVRPGSEPVWFGNQVHKLEFMAEEDPEVKVDVLLRPARRM